MFRLRRLALAALISACLAACAGPAKKPLVDPFPLRFPLVEAGAIDIEGTVVGQPRARDGIVYYGTREGYVTAVVVRSQAVLWRFQAESPVAFSPELGDGYVIVRDGGGRFYVFDENGKVVLKKTPAEGLTTAVKEAGGRLFFGTMTGRIVALELAAGGREIWEFRAPAAITSGPVFVGDMVLFGCEDGRLLALDRDGRALWTFEAEGAIHVDPAADRGHIYFGSTRRSFYCLDSATGKKRWSRRLQGAPLHPAFISGGRVALAASNSAVYILSGRGGSILSWEAVPSRVVHELAAAGTVLLVASASRSLAALDIPTGKRAGQFEASAPLAAGALWVPPVVVLFEEDPGRGRQRLVILGPRPASASGPAGIRAPGR